MPSPRRLHLANTVHMLQVPFVTWTVSLACKYHSQPINKQFTLPFSLHPGFSNASYRLPNASQCYAILSRSYSEHVIFFTTHNIIFTKQFNIQFISICSPCWFLVKLIEKQRYSLQSMLNDKDSRSGFLAFITKHRLGGRSHKHTHTHIHTHTQLILIWNLVKYRLPISYASLDQFLIFHVEREPKCVFCTNQKS